MKHPAFQTLEAYYGTLSGVGPASEIAGFCHLPAAIIIGGQKWLFTTEGDVDALYSQAKKRYRAEEIAKITWDDTETSLFQIYPYLVLIKTIISRERADGHVVKRWACSYLVREFNDAWKFDVVTAIPN